MTTFTLPDLGEGLHEAELVAWHVAAGDHVVADQPLVSVETDKAVVEVPSPRSGRIARLCAAAGERVKVGSPLVEFEEGAHPDSGTVVGELAMPTPAPSTPAPRGPTAGNVNVNAAPAVRARARELGVDLSRIEPKGPDGAVSMQDVDAAATVARAEAGAEELKGVRRAMAINMRRSGDAIVPATVSDDADIGDWGAHEDVTLRLVRAVVAGCQAAPALNAWYDEARLERRLHAAVDLGIAVDTPDGLIVPVLRDAGRHDPAALRQAIDTLTTQARNRTVPLTELRGQSITLSNFGALAGRYASLAIMPPQVAILGAGRARPELRASNGQPSIRRVLPLSLTFDHRVVSGGEAARFLQAVITDLERPA